MKTFSFTDFQSVQPNTPLPGIQIDSQLDDISDVTTQAANAIKDVRRSDGALKNQIVTEDSLAPGLLSTLRAETDAALVETYRDDAAASASAAALSASELGIAVGVISSLGALLDWGEITQVAGQNLDYGDLT